MGRQVLLENRRVPDGETRFVDVSDRAGVDRDAVGFSAVAADVNADGHTDVYVASYNRYGTVMPNSWHKATNGTPNLLFLSNGDGTFVEASAEWGVDDGRWSYAAGFIDFDEDGDHDGRASRTGRIVECDGVVGRIRGHARDIPDHLLDQTDARRCVIGCRLSDRLGYDHAGAVDTEMQLLPATLAAVPVFRCGPLALADD